MALNFDVCVLRKRRQMHELRDEGLSSGEIAQIVRMHTDKVTHYLKRVKPRVSYALSPWWTDEAACLGDYDTFFPSGRGRGAASQREYAMGVCRRCPVKRRCLEAAEANYEKHGIWGGVDFSRYTYSYNERTGVITRRTKWGGGAVAKVS